MGVIIAVLLMVLFSGQPPSKGTSNGAGSEFKPDKDLTITSPSLNAVIGDPVSVAGVANGIWAKHPFEVQVYSGDGMLLGSVLAQFIVNNASTTETDVPFVANLPYVPSGSAAVGNIVFSALDPSAATGTAGVTASFSLPIKFK